MKSNFQENNKSYLTHSNSSRQQDLEYESFDLNKIQNGESYRQEILINNSQTFLNFEKKVLKVQWTQEQEQLLLSLYQQYGPSWTMMTLKFPKKAELALKNKFNSYLRKAIKILANHDKKVLKKLNKGIEKIIGVMLEFSHQVQKLIQNLKLTVNKNSLLFTFRSQILRLCFKRQDFSSNDLTQLSNLIKGLNTKLRCFGAFKCKSLKGWRLSYQNFWIVSNFDKVCIEDRGEIENKIKENGGYIQRVKFPKQKNHQQKQVEKHLFQQLPELDQQYFQKFRHRDNNFALQQDILEIYENLQFIC